MTDKWDGVRFGDVELSKFHEDFVLHKHDFDAHKELEEEKSDEILYKLTKLEKDTEDMIKAWNGVVVLSKFLSYIAGLSGILAIVLYLKKGG